MASAAARVSAAPVSTLGRSTDDDRAKASVSGDPLAHLTGAERSSQAGPGSGERIQHHLRPLFACGSAPRVRASLRIAAVSVPLSPDAAAHAGDGVDDEAEFLPGHCVPLSRNRRPRGRPGRA